MPLNYGDTVTDQKKLDAVTYILQVNGFPSGPGELKLATEDLATALILRKGSRRWCRTSRWSGSRLPGQGRRQHLAADQEHRTGHHGDDTSTPQMLTAAATRPLGDKTVRLLNSVPFKPERTSATAWKRAA